MTQLELIKEARTLVNNATFQQLNGHSREAQLSLILLRELLNTQPELEAGGSDRLSNSVDLALRPLLNPKASAVKQDKQLRLQQAWDKEYNGKQRK